MTRTRLAALGAAVLLATALPGPAAAGPRTVSASYQVTAVPGAPAYYASDATCGASVEEVHKDVRPLKAPFSGWLRAELTGLTGDWDLALADATGSALAWGGGQFLVVGDRERLAYYVTAGQELQIVVCNYAGSSSARVAYSLVEGSDGVTRSKAYREARRVLSYVSPAAGTHDRWFLCYVGYSVGCAADEPPAWARFVRISIDDAVSADVAANFYSYSGETAFREQEFCTDTDQPIALKPHVDWAGVVVFNGPCLDGTPAQATQGKVTLTFSTHATRPG